MDCEEASGFWCLGVCAAAGIEAESVMLGQPMSMVLPPVVGYRLEGSLPAGVTATDLVLTCVQQLRKHGVVGKFVEFHGSGVQVQPRAQLFLLLYLRPVVGGVARPRRRVAAGLSTPGPGCRRRWCYPCMLRVQGLRAARLPVHSSGWCASSCWELRPKGAGTAAVCTHPGSQRMENDLQEEMSDRATDSCWARRAVATGSSTRVDQAANCKQAPAWLMIG